MALKPEAHLTVSEKSRFPIIVHSPITIFSSYTHNKHPIGHPWGWDVGYISLDFQWSM